MPAGEYQKCMPKFTGTEGVIFEEHLKSFYSYANNLDISEDDVLMRVFVQSLDGEARKWFRELTPRSITDIEASDDVFLKHWETRKTCYTTIMSLGISKVKMGNHCLILIRDSIRCIAKY